MIRGLAGRAQGRSLYYPTQGSALRELLVDGERLYVQTCEAYAIALTGGCDRGMSATERTGEDGAQISGASCDLAPFRGSYCHITVVDQGEPQTLGQPYLALKNELPRIPVMRSSRPQQRGGGSRARGLLAILRDPLRFSFFSAGF